MNYQNYEDYMRQVLGYSPYSGNNYTYTNEQEDIYNYSNEFIPTEKTQDLTQFYPEIYKIMYPMICKVCNINSNKELTEELLNKMVDEIYNNMEPEQDEKIQSRNLPPLKNGDVRNPNAKETENSIKNTRQTNFLLRDLIKILILREWGRSVRHPIRPPFPPYGRPPMGNYPQRPRYF